MLEVSVFFDVSSNLNAKSELIVEYAINLHPSRSDSKARSMISLFNQWPGHR